MLSPFPECSLVCSHTKSKTDLTWFALCSSGRADLLHEAVECSFLCPQASAWVTWLDDKLKTWKCQDTGPALEESQSVTSCWGAWFRIQDSSVFLCYGERRTSHRGGFDLFHLTICFLFSFFLMPITQTLPLASTPEAHPGGIPTFLYPEAEGLVIPSCYTKDSQQTEAS